MKRYMTLVGCVVLIGSGLGCSYHRAYVSYSKYEEDVQVAAAGWDGRRLGPVSARESIADYPDPGRSRGCVHVARDDEADAERTNGCAPGRL